MEMENHPIPLDVTGFKFKLIGSMTIKQFLYLLAAGVLVSLLLIIPGNLLLKLPFITLFSLIGFSLAFIPIDGRPMDKMIANFIRLLPSENLYVYRKKGANLSSFEIFDAPKQEVKVEESATKNSSSTSTLFKKPHVKLEENELDFLKKVKGFFSDSALQTKITVQNPAPAPSIPRVPTNEPEEALKIRVQIQQIKKQEEMEGTSVELQNKIKELEARLTNLLAENSALQNKVFEIQRQVPNEQVFSPGGETQNQVTPNARLVDAASQVKAGFPSLPDIGNVVMGIVKDPRGRILPNIIVEVVDQNNIPVRAFKTNKLGQFAAATPLPNGTFKIHFEDPQKNHDFDTIEVNLNGQVFLPLEVISVDSRERLRKELFGTNQVH